jgi:hypothetical protein
MRRRNMLLASLAAFAAPAARAAAAGPVVLELFTSQGCSSCPPADALLGTLVQDPGVIALAWHVDYWNHLGWLDVFASRDATARQRAYARQLGSEVFTPALVIDGADVVVGSDRGAVERAIQSAQPLRVPVTLSRTGDGMAVNIGSSPTPLRALSILYDPEHTTDVGSGENGGTRLHEYRIVRRIDSLGDWDGASRQFVLPPLGTGQGQIVLVQTADLRVVGAVERSPIGNKPS